MNKNGEIKLLATSNEVSALAGSLSVLSEYNLISEEDTVGDRFILQSWVGMDKDSPISHSGRFHSL